MYYINIWLCNLIECNGIFLVFPNMISFPEHFLFLFLSPFSLGSFVWTQMPPLPLDERIVVIQRPKNLDLCQSSPQNLAQHSSQISGSSNGQVAHHPHLPPSQSQFYSPHAKSLTLECKRRSARAQKLKAEQPAVPSGGRHIPSHCHSNGTVTLGPRLPSHTHTIDIRVTVDKGGRRGASSNSLGRSESVKGGKGKCASSQFDQGQWERKNGSTGRRVGAEHGRYNQLSSSLGGVLQFIPSQAQQLQFRSEKEKENISFPFRNDHEYSCVGHRQNSKLGTVHQDHSLPHHHGSVPVPHAAILNSTYSSSPPSQPTHVLTSFQQFKPPHLSRDHRPHILHGLPLSPCSSHPGGFPSPDHTCTIDCTHPFTCGCWRLVRCRFFKEHSAGCPGGGGSSSTSVSGAHNNGVKKKGKEMGLRNLGGCLSTTSTSNTSSSNSTVSDCRTNLFKPLHCASCSGEAGNLESPAIYRKKLAGGCLPCAPLSSAPFRAIQSCVTGCNPKASQTGSSSCSYCSSDPIVVTFNPRRGKPLGRGIRPAHPMGMYQGDDDEYSVRTIWPEEVADRMTHSKATKNYCGRVAPSTSNNADLVPLDCQNLQGYNRSQIADRTGRRRLQQGKMSALDFMSRSSGSGYDEGQNSLKRLLTTAEDMGMEDCHEQDGDTAYPHSPSPRSASPPSPLSFSPPPSTPSTLIKPKPRQRDRDGGHSLPSARSLHLDLNSLNAEQDEENSRSKNNSRFTCKLQYLHWGGARHPQQIEVLAHHRWCPSESLPCLPAVHLSLPLSSSLPASLSDESVMTPDAENAVVSPILPFLFLGNERDAQDLDLLRNLNIGYVVNVTTHLPLYHVNSGLRYKRLPATDNSKQNLRQYFEEVFEFIGKHKHDNMEWKQMWNLKGKQGNFAGWNTRTIYLLCKRKETQVTIPDTDLRASHTLQTQSSHWHMI